MYKSFIIAASASLLLASCSGEKDIELLPETAFEKTVEGKPVQLFTLENKNGMTVQLTNFGARVVSLWVPASDGTFKDVVWGYDSIDSYLEASDKYSGPIVGRYGNRIKDGRFSIDGVEYSVDKNENGNHLHGGSGGFSTRIWSAGTFTDEEGNSSVKMEYLSEDGEQGYPGNLAISVTYTLTADNALVIGYRATTDKATVVNPTSHIYFNLHGTSEASTDSHLLEINADNFTPTDEKLIPTGEIAPVTGTPMDFRKALAIGERIDMKEYGPLRFGNGYDHNWVLNKTGNEKTSFAARLSEPSTGIVMEIYTDQPGLQFYAGQGMDGKETGKRGQKHNFRSGVALETQNFPDAPNHPNFPNSVLRPGETYTQHTEYRFMVK